MKNASILLGFFIIAISSSFNRVEGNDFTQCPEDFNIRVLYGRDCLQFYVDGTAVSSFTFVSYTITFSNLASNPIITTKTVKVLNSSTGFLTNDYGPGCGLTPIAACATGRYQCGETFVTSHSECWP